MIVDINRRQCGKTTRLIDHAAKLLKENKDIVIVSRAKNYSKDIVEKLFKLYPECSRYAKNIKTSTGMIEDKINLVDEFGFINTLNLFVDKNCYYNASAESIDLLKTTEVYKKLIETYSFEFYKESFYLNNAKRFFYN